MHLYRNLKNTFYIFLHSDLHQSSADVAISSQRQEDPSWEYVPDTAVQQPETKEMRSKMICSNIWIGLRAGKEENGRAPALQMVCEVSQNKPVSRPWYAVTVKWRRGSCHLHVHKLCTEIRGTSQTDVTIAAYVEFSNLGSPYHIFASFCQFSGKARPVSWRWIIIVPGSTTVLDLGPLKKNLAAYDSWRDLV